MWRLERFEAMDTAITEVREWEEYEADMAMQRDELPTEEEIEEMARDAT